MKRRAFAASTLPQDEEGTSFSEVFRNSQTNGKYVRLVDLAPSQEMQRRLETENSQLKTIVDNLLRENEILRRKSAARTN